MSSRSPEIVVVEAISEGVLVTFADDPNPELLTWFWIQDHSQDEHSLNQATLQRQVDTFALSSKARPSDVRLSEQGDLVVDWDEAGLSARLSAGLLQSTRRNAARGSNIHLWSSGTALDCRPVQYADVLTQDGLRRLLIQVRDTGVGLVTGIPTTQAAALELATQVGPPRSTIFGTMWPLSSSVKAHDDTAYSNSYLEPHTDGTYCHDAPGLQLFCCLERDGTGGDSIMVDGFALAEEMRRDEPEAFATLTRVTVPGHYLEPGVHLKAERPAIRLDAAGRVVQISLNNYDRAPFRLPEPAMTEFYDAYRELHRRVVDQSAWFTVRLEPGQAVLFDNWRVLHGRLAYRGTRVFEGCYHNREDFESKLRVLGEPVGGWAQ